MSNPHYSFLLPNNAISYHCPNLTTEAAQEMRLTHGHTSLVPYRTMTYEKESTLLNTHPRA